jgi:hypothetical protein
MKRYILLTVALLLSVMPTYSAGADDQKVLVIIDTAISEEYSSSVLHEVCFNSHQATCPTKTFFSEGAGSAQVSKEDLRINGIQHGSDMVGVALAKNKNIKIIFIRVGEIHRYPNSSFLYTSQVSVDKAMKWVDENVGKYSIDAVSISQASSRHTRGTCPRNINFETSVENLKIKNVLVFSGAGNNGRINYVSYPACVNNVISVSSASNNGLIPWEFAWFANVGVGVDYFSVGRVTFTTPSGNKKTLSGTSVSSPNLAALWLEKFSGTWEQQMQDSQRYAIIKSYGQQPRDVGNKFNEIKDLSYYFIN